MSELEKQENQKTIVAFAAGLLIGGLLVWVFGGAPKDEPKEEAQAQNKTATEVVEGTNTETTAEVADEAKPQMSVGEGKVEVANQPASQTVTIGGATFPTDEGWVGVRDYADGATSYILGVARYSSEQGLIPTEISLQRSTVAGKEYAIVFFKESGDRKFNASLDTQLEGVVATFKAQ